MKKQFNREENQKAKNNQWNQKAAYRSSIT